MKLFRKKLHEGFTLIETMVAISILMIALIAPMSLASQSLTAAYYSRNQITAFYLAQEGIEIVRAMRDANIIAIARGNSSTNIFDNIPYGTSAATAPLFTVDSTQITSNALDTCAQMNGTYVCPPLQTQATNPILAYSQSCEPAGPNGTWSTVDCGSSNGWSDTAFTRSIKAYLLNSTDQDEMRVTVTVTWQQGLFHAQSFTINEDLYRWVNG